MELLKCDSIKVQLYAEGVDDAFGSACFIKINLQLKLETENLSFNL